MGSTGGNTFGNYAPAGPTKCEQVIEVPLEDVARLDYFRSSKSVPSEGVDVRVRNEMHNGRLIVEDLAGTPIGNLPTIYNYLILCMKEGYGYQGTVTNSATVPFPSVEVSLEPS